MNSKIFEKTKPLVGVLQLLPLPGSLGWKGRIDQLIARAEQEASALATGGVDGILVENTFDAPYIDSRMDVAGAIAMGLVIRRIMHFTHLPIGVNVLRNDPETALAIAMNVGAKFIRVSLLTGSSICDAGFLEGAYARLEAYKQRLQPHNIAVFADISLEKAPALGKGQTPPSLFQLARQALDPGGADGLIVTDVQHEPEVLQQLSQTLDVPVFYDYPHGLSQVKEYLAASDGLIVSTPIKKTSMALADAPPTIDLTKVEELVAIADVVREQALTSV